MAYPGYVYKPYPKMISHPSLSYRGHAGYTIVNSKEEEADVLEKIKGISGVPVAPVGKKENTATGTTQGRAKKLMFEEG